MKKILNSFFLLFIALAIFNACSDVPAPYEIGGGNNDNNDIYINESFSSSLGNFRSQSALGNLKWKIDFSSAVITGFDKTATPQNQAGITYLVSPSINLSKSTGAYITFEHAINYERGKIADNNQLLISKNYKGDVKTAAWDTLVINTKGTNTDFTFVNAGNITIPSKYIGNDNNEITVALRHTCTEQSSSTWEVKNFKVIEGKGDEPSISEGEGDGTEKKPYTVSQVIKLNNSGETAWVTGYIVGAAVSDQSITTITSKDDVVFGTTGIRPSMVLIAESANINDYTKCVSVSLPSGNIRSAINLVDNPDNLGKKLSIEGILKNSFGLCGVKDITNYKLDEEEHSGEIILSETFTNGFGSFTTQDVEGDQQWTEDTTYGYVKMSAYNSGTTYANEDWLISPAINLNKTTTLTFEQVFGPAGGSFDNATSLYTLWTSTDYTNDVKAANWSKVDISYPGASGWNPWQKVEITLPLLTENARIAFKYKNAATDNTLTWEIKNLTIK